MEPLWELDGSVKRKEWFNDLLWWFSCSNMPFFVCTEKWLKTTELCKYKTIFIVGSGNME